MSLQAFRMKGSWVTEVGHPAKSNTGKDFLIMAGSKVLRW